MREESVKLSDKVQELHIEKSDLKMKFSIFEKMKLDEISALKAKLCSSERAVQEKSRQIKELWDVIQMLYDTNMSLIRRADILEQSEKQLKKEVSDLKGQLVNGDIELDALVCPCTVDWKAKLVKDLSGWRPKRKKKKIYQSIDKKFERGWIHRDEKKVSMSTREKRHTLSSKPTLEQRHSAPAVMAEGPGSIVFKDVNDAISENTGVFEVQLACAHKVVQKSNPWKVKDSSIDGIVSAGPVWGSAVWPRECIISRKVSQQRKSHLENAEW